MRLNNLLDGENPLGAYVDGRIGDALEVRMVASLVNTFVCQRAEEQGRAPRPAKSVNKERIKALLASHRYFGPRLRDAEELVLATQTLKIERKR